jgi:Protein of unknown function (DUF3800)
VRLVYMDEAGISKASEEPFVVVAGVVVHADTKLNGVEAALEGILRRNIPERLRDGFVFSAKEVFNGGKTLQRMKDQDFIGPHEWPLQRRLAIAEEIVDLPRKFQLPIAIGFVERATVREDLDLPDVPESEITLAAHVSAFMSCAIMTEHWMRTATTNENCMLVVENNEDAKKMIGEVQRYHQDKRIEAILDDVTRRHFPLRKIKEDPAFQPKKQNHPLILADFCAYLFKKYLMKDERYNRPINQIKDHLVSFDEDYLNRKPGRWSRRARHSAG